MTIMLISIFYCPPRASECSYLIVYQSSVEHNTHLTEYKDKIDKIFNTCQFFVGAKNDYNFSAFYLNSLCAVLLFTLSVPVRLQNKFPSQ